MRIPAGAIFSLVLAATCLWSQQTKWKDPSPHRVQFVRVEDDVQLEVLDWGGSGRAVVLLAGSGNSAHIVTSRDISPRRQPLCPI
jgi:hypothetical protein